MILLLLLRTTCSYSLKLKIAKTGTSSFVTILTAKKKIVTLYQILLRAT